MRNKNLILWFFLFVLGKGAASPTPYGIFTDERTVKISPYLFMPYPVDRSFLEGEPKEYLNQKLPLYASTPSTTVFEFRYRTISGNWGVRIPPRLREVRVLVWENNKQIVDSLFLHKQDLAEVIDDPIKTLNLFLKKESIYRIAFEIPAFCQLTGVLILFPEKERLEESSLLWFTGHGLTGVLLSIFLINTVLLLVFRLRNFFWFLSYLVFYGGMSLFFLQMDRIFFSGVFDEGAIWLDLCMLGMLFSLLKFCSIYFNWEENRPDWDSATERVTVLVVGLAILRILGVGPVLYFFTEYTLIFGLFGFLLIAFVEWRGKHPYSLYFLLGLVIHFLGLLVVVLNEFSDFLPMGLFYGHFPTLVGALLQMLSLTALVSQRVMGKIRQGHLEVVGQLQFRKSLIRNMSHELRTPMVGLLSVADELPELSHLTSKRRAEIYAKITRLKWILNFLLVRMSTEATLRKTHMNNGDVEIYCNRYLKEIYLDSSFSRKGPTEIPLEVQFEEVVDVLLIVLDFLLSQCRVPKLNWEWSCDQNEWTLRISGNAYANPFKNKNKIFESAMNWLNLHFGQLQAVWEKDFWILFFVKKVDWEKPKVNEWKTNHNSIIAVVDDNVLNRKVLAKIIQRIGFKVHEYNSGEEFLEGIKLDHKMTKIVLMDIQMPQKDGLETTRELRIIEESEGWAPLSVWAVTALQTSTIYQQCLDAGMQGVFAKPYDAKRLEKLLKEGR